MKEVVLSTYIVVTGSKDLIQFRLAVCSVQAKTGAGLEGGQVPLEFRLAVCGVQAETGADPEGEEVLHC